MRSRFQSPAIIFFALTTLVGISGPNLWGQSFVVGTIDVYGNRSVPEHAVLEALKISPGDTISPDTFSSKSAEANLKQVPGIMHATVNPVCCDTLGRLMLYIGIGEDDSGIINYREEPSDTLRLPGYMKAAYDSLQSQIIPAIQSGQGDEDDTQGYAITRFPPVRKQQEKFIRYAHDDFPLLARVLATSRYDEDRAAAAAILCYSDNKLDVARVLLAAIDDPAEEVRNNAIRGLGTLAIYTMAHPEMHIIIPATPFIRLINSIVWTDRNKGARALMQITKNRDQSVLQALKDQALPSIVEMARWKDRGHAAFAFVLLGRIAGEDEQRLLPENFSGDWSTDIDQMLKKIQK